VWRYVKQHRYVQNIKRSSFKRVNKLVFYIFPYLYTVFHNFSVGLLILDLKTSSSTGTTHIEVIVSTVKLPHPVLKLDLGSLSCPLL